MKIKEIARVAVVLMLCVLPVVAQAYDYDNITETDFTSRTTSKGMPYYANGTWYGLYHANSNCTIPKGEAEHGIKSYVKVYPPCKGSLTISFGKESGAGATNKERFAIAYNGTLVTSASCGTTVHCASDYSKSWLMSSITGTSFSSDGNWYDADATLKSSPLPDLYQLQFHHTAAKIIWATSMQIELEKHIYLDHTKDTIGTSDYRVRTSCTVGQSQQITISFRSFLITNNHITIKKRSGGSSDFSLNSSSYWTLQNGELVATFNRGNVCGVKGGTERFPNSATDYPTRAGNAANYDFVITYTPTSADSKTVVFDIYDGDATGTPKATVTIQAEDFLSNGQPYYGEEKTEAYPDGNGVWKWFSAYYDWMTPQGAPINTYKTHAVYGPCETVNENCTIKVQSKYSYDGSYNYTKFKLYLISDQETGTTSPKGDFDNNGYGLGYWNLEGCGSDVRSWAWFPGTRNCSTLLSKSLDIPVSYPNTYEVKLYSESYTGFNYNNLQIHLANHILLGSSRFGVSDTTVSISPNSSAQEYIIPIRSFLLEHGKITIKMSNGSPDVFKYNNSTDAQISSTGVVVGTFSQDVVCGVAGGTGDYVGSSTSHTPGNASTYDLHIWYDPTAAGSKTATFEIYDGDASTGTKKATVTLGVQQLSNGEPYFDGTQWYSAYYQYAKDQNIPTGDIGIYPPSQQSAKCDGTANDRSVKCKSDGTSKVILYIGEHESDNTGNHFSFTNVSSRKTYSYFINSGMVDATYFNFGLSSGSAAYFNEIAIPLAQHIRLVDTSNPNVGSSSLTLDKTGTTTYIGGSQKITIPIRSFLINGNLKVYRTYGNSEVFRLFNSDYTSASPKTLLTNSDNDVLCGIAGGSAGSDYSGASHRAGNASLINIELYYYPTSTDEQTCTLRVESGSTYATVIVKAKGSKAIKSDGTKPYYNGTKWYSLYDYNTEYSLYYTGDTKSKEFSVYSPCVRTLSFKYHYDKSSYGYIDIYNDGHQFTQNQFGYKEAYGDAVTATPPTDNITTIKFERSNSPTLTAYLYQIYMELACHVRLTGGTYGTTTHSQHDFGSTYTDQPVANCTINVRSFLTATNLVLKIEDSSNNLSSHFKIKKIGDNDVNSNTYTITNTANICGYSGASAPTSSTPAIPVNTDDMSIVVEYTPMSGGESLQTPMAHNANLVFYDGTVQRVTIPLTGSAAKRSQTVTFADDQVRSGEYRDRAIPIELNASSSVSQLNGDPMPITYTSSNPSVATVSGPDANGKYWLNMIIAGNTIITATAGDAATLTATDTIHFTVNKSDPDLHFTLCPTAISYSTVNGAYQYTAESDDVQNGTVTYNIVAVSPYTGVASINNNGQLTTLKTGQFKVSATLAEVSNMWNSRTIESEVITVGTADQTLSWHSSSDITDKPVGSIINLTYVAQSTSGLTPHYALVAGDGVVATITEQSGVQYIQLLKQGTFRLRVTQTGDANYNPATPLEGDFNVVVASSLLTYDVTYTDAITYGDNSHYVEATCKNRSGVAVTYSSDNTSVATVNATTGYITPVGVGTCNIIAHVDGLADYYAEANCTTQVTIIRASSTLVWDTGKEPVSAQFNSTNNDQNISAATTSNGTVQYSITSAVPSDGASVDANGLLHITKVGTYTVTASVAQTDQYDAPADLNETITIFQGDPALTISGTDMARYTTQLLTYQTDNTEAAAGDWTWTSSDTNVLTVASDGTVTAHNMGSANVTAILAATTTWNAVTSNTLTITVTNGTLYFVGGETGDDWSNVNNWSTQSGGTVHPTNLPDATDYVQIQANCTIPDATIAYCLGLSFSATDKQLTINPDATLDAGVIVNTNAASLLLKADASHQATVMLLGGNPDATIECCFRGTIHPGGGKNNPDWQYRGFIGDNASLTDWTNIVIFGWTETTNATTCWTGNGTTPLYTGTGTINGPNWAGFCMANYGDPDDIHSYTTKLSSTKGVSARHTYNLSRTETDKGSASAPNCGVNLITNSWSAPLDMTQGVTFAGGAESTFYIYKTCTHNEFDDTTSFITYPEKTGWTTNTDNLIPAGQSFLVRTNTNGGTLTVDANALSAEASGAMYAPRHEEFNVLRIILSSSHGVDRLTLIENENCSSGFDNGYDGTKMMQSSTAQIYATNSFGNTAVNSDRSMLGQLIGCKAAADGDRCTITFETDMLTGFDELYLFDRTTHIYTDILNGDSYSFNASVDGDGQRFEIVGRRDDGTEYVSSADRMIEVVGNRALLSGFSDSSDPVYITDLRGNRLWTANTKEGPWFEIPNLPAGVYIIYCDNISTKFVVK